LSFDESPLDTARFDTPFLRYATRPPFFAIAEFHATHYHLLYAFAFRRFRWLRRFSHIFISFSDYAATLFAIDTMMPPLLRQIYAIFAVDAIA
jgi:hypothetical protein